MSVVRGIWQESVTMSWDWMWKGEQSSFKSGGCASTVFREAIFWSFVRRGLDVRYVPGGMTPCYMEGSSKEDREANTNMMGTQTWRQMVGTHLVTSHQESTRGLLMKMVISRESWRKSEVYGFRLVLCKYKNVGFVPCWFLSLLYMLFYMELEEEGVLATNWTDQTPPATLALSADLPKSTSLLRFHKNGLCFMFVFDSRYRCYLFIFLLRKGLSIFPLLSLNPLSRVWPKWLLRHVKKIWFSPNQARTGLKR